MPRQSHRAHHAIFKLGALGIADAIERRPFASRKCADPFHDGFDHIRFGCGEAFVPGQFFDTGTHIDREQLVLGGGRKGRHVNFLGGCIDAGFRAGSSREYLGFSVSHL